MIKNVTVFVTLYFSFSFSLYTQEAILTAGGNTQENNSSTISFSIGQLFVNFKSNSTGSLTEGIQQSFILNPLDIDENLLKNIKIYPNPTSKFLFINPNNQPIKVELYDIQGKLLFKKEVKTLQKIDLRNLSLSTYLLKISNVEKSKISNFKIIKQN